MAAADDELEEKEEEGKEVAAKEAEEDVAKETASETIDGEEEPQQQQLLRGEGPNCRTVPIDFPERIFADDGSLLRPYIPNEYEKPPKSWGQSLLDKDDPMAMRGMGIIALRDLEDEELVYDYRLSPSSTEAEGGKSGGGDGSKGGKGEGGDDASSDLGGYPSWYHVWDEEAIRNRWQNER